MRIELSGVDTEDFRMVTVLCHGENLAEIRYDSVGDKWVLKHEGVLGEFETPNLFEALRKLTNDH